MKRDTYRKINFNNIKAKVNKLKGKYSGNGKDGNELLRDMKFVLT